MTRTFNPHPYQQPPYLVRARFLVLGVICLLVTIGLIFATDSAAASQRQGQDHGASGKSSAQKSDTQKKDVDSVQCAPESQERKALAAPNKTDVHTPEPQQRMQEKRPGDASRAALTLATPSEKDELQDQMQRDEPTTSMRSSHRDQPASSSIGSDRQCTQQQDSLKIEPVTPD